MADVIQVGVPLWQLALMVVGVAAVLMAASVWLRRGRPDLQRARGRPRLVDPAPGSCRRHFPVAPLGCKVQDRDHTRL